MEVNKWIQVPDFMPGDFLRRNSITDQQINTEESHAMALPFGLVALSFSPDRTTGNRSWYSL